MEGPLWRNVVHVAQSLKQPGKEASAKTAGQESLLEELHLSADSLVQEIGADDDVDDSLRDGLEELLDEPLIDEDEQEVVDAVLLWFREGDDDLTDSLMDALTTLDENGAVWLLTPRKGRDGYVAPVEIQDAAPNAGLHVTTSAGVSENWAASRLVHRKSF